MVYVWCANRLAATTRSSFAPLAGSVEDGKTNHEQLLKKAQMIMIESFINALGMNEKGNVNRVLNKNEINICYNSRIEKDYDEGMKNILMAIESPGVVEYKNWVKDYMKFQAEISFKKFSDAKYHHKPTKLYATNDNFLDFNIRKKYENKDELAFIMYSKSDYLTGHKLRHEVAKEFGGRLNLYGSGEDGGFVRKEPIGANHMFQVVIENVKSPYYVSEKLYDSLKTKCVPIYRGGKKAIENMGFDKNGILFFEDKSDLRDILNRVSKNMYNEILDCVEFNRNRLIKIRNNIRMSYIMSYIRDGYMHTEESYKKGVKKNINLEFE